MSNSGRLTSNTDEWATPQSLFDSLNDEFHFDLDPCATADNAKCARYFTKETNGLLEDWNGRVFMNPPYGRYIGRWIRAAWREYASGHAEVVVCLLPARTDTAWWHEYCMKGEIRFIRGRVKFGDSRFNAPFPSAIVIFK